MRHWLMKHEENVRCSKYESEIKQTPTHIWVITNTRWTDVEYEAVIVALASLALISIASHTSCHLDFSYFPVDYGEQAPKLHSTSFLPHYQFPAFFCVLSRKYLQYAVLVLSKIFNLNSCFFANSILITNPAAPLSNSVSYVTSS